MTQREGMYRDAQSDVLIAKGLPEESHYVVEMPTGVVHELPNIERGELDIKTVNELLDIYGAQVY